MNKAPNWYSTKICIKVAFNEIRNKQRVLYYLFLFILLVRQKNIFNFDKSKLFSINSIPSVSLVINHIEILSLNNHLLNDRDFINSFDIT